MIDLPLTLVVELLFDLALSYDSESLLGVELALSDGSRSIVPRGHGNVVVSREVVGASGTNSAGPGRNLRGSRAVGLHPTQRGVLAISGSKSPK